jgi:hypothetical protein
MEMVPVVPTLGFYASGDAGPGFQLLAAFLATTPLFSAIRAPDARGAQV